MKAIKRQVSSGIGAMLSKKSSHTWAIGREITSIGRKINVNKKY